MASKELGDFNKSLLDDKEEDKQRKEKSEREARRMAIAYSSSLFSSFLLISPLLSSLPFMCVLIPSIPNLSILTMMTTAHDEVYHNNVDDVMISIPSPKYRVSFRPNDNLHRNKAHATSEKDEKKR